MADKDSKSPATTSMAYDAMAGRWDLIETVLGGTEAMRAAADRFLPKHEEETDEGYRIRLGSAVLLNITEQTLDTLSSQPFAEEMEMEDVPSQIEENILPNVDLQGNNLDVFARTWFREGLAKAFCHVLVDMPRPRPPVEGQTRTLEDDRREGIRPYWVMVKPEHVLFAQAEMVDGKEVLNHVRILECYTEMAGFAEVEKKRIRVLEPGMVTLYVPKPRTNASQKEEWVQEDQWTTALSYIPLVTFYATRSGFMYAKPPLLDLAYLNVAHWQSTADQRNILRVGRFPIITCEANNDDGADITLGTNKVLYGGKYAYLEHKGTAIEAGRKDLEDLERQMSGYGAQFLEDDPGNPTATAKAIDTAEESSTLSAMVLRFEDAIAQALDITADWLKIVAPEGGGTVELLKDFTPEAPDAPGLDALDKARTRRDISRVAYLDGLKARGVLPADFDQETDLELLNDEVGELVGATGLDLHQGGIDPTTGLPYPPEPAPEPSPAQKPAAKKTAPEPSPAQKPAAKKTAPAKKTPAAKRAAS